LQANFQPLILYNVCYQYPREYLFFSPHFLGICFLNSHKMGICNILPIFIDFCLNLGYNWAMDNVKEIVSKNLIKLRKKNGLTQAELASKINYSDNSISNWEKGDVLPSLETLQTLALVYGVPLSYFIEEHTDEQTKIYNRKKRSLSFAIMASGILSILTICVLIFVILYNQTGKYYYSCLAWGAPIIAYIIKFTIQKCFKNKFYLLTTSIFAWSLLFAIYFQWFSLNLWPIFLCGMPVQITLILIYVFRELKKDTPNLKDNKRKK